MRRLADGWLLATGTLTTLRVPPVLRVDGGVAGAAMVVAPVAALPLGLVVALVALAGGALALPTLLTALLCVGSLALGTRVLHWDGLADTADGLTASYSPERSLAVMRTGDVGPAGVVAVAVVLGLQVAGLASLLTRDRGWLLAGLLVCVARGVLALCCARGVPHARPDGLGAAYAGSVSPLTAGLTTVLLGAATTYGAQWAGAPWWAGLLGHLLSLAAAGLLLVRITRRLGGVTGDVYGAAVELSFAALLVGCAAS